MDITAFTEIITQLQSADNDIRKQAETHYENIDAPSKIAAFFEMYAQNPNNVALRETVLVFLRRLLASDWDDLWAALNEENRQKILDKTLEIIVNETELSVKKKVADVISEIAGNLIDDGGNQSWKKVLEFLNHCLNTDDATANFIALLIIKGCPIVLGSATSHFVPALKNVFQKFMTQGDFQSKSIAVKAAICFAIDNDDEKDVIKCVSSLVPSMLQVCTETPEEEETDGPLADLSELASSAPKSITPHLENVLQVCLTIAMNKSKTELARQNAFEVVISYIETAPKAFKKNAIASIPHLIEIIMDSMTELSDDQLEEWLNTTEEDEDFDDMPIVGESVLDRLSCALNGKILLPQFLAIAEKYLVRDDWKSKHAALRALAAIGEGCQRSMEPHIEQIMAHVCKFASDSHPRVRYAACNAIGQMSTDFGPTMQKKCHAQALPALAQCLGDAENARVCAHAAAALINFCEECPKNIMAQYLQYIIPVLEQSLGATYNRLNDEKYKTVVENLVTATASVAEAAEEHFKGHHQNLVPSLVQMLHHTTELKELRGKTIECISLIGYAVGKEEFHQTACEIMNLLGSGMADMAIDDPQYSYMISSWTRFCSMLGPDFAPYLPIVMNPVLRAAEYTPKFNILNRDEIDENDDSFHYANLNNEQSIGIRTSGLEEKATSCDMLVAFAREMKDAFLPWVPQVSQLALKNLDFELHDGVRSASAEVMPYLITAVENQGVDAKRQLWVEFLKALAEGLESNDDIEIIGAFINGLAECIQAMGAQAISHEELSVVINCLSKQMEAYGKRMSDRPKDDEEDDDNEFDEDHDYMMELETALLGSMADLVHSLMKEFKHVVYEPLVPIFHCAVQLIQSPDQFFERQWGMCILDDAIEFGNDHVPSRFHFVPVMIKLLEDEYPEVRQAAAYGFGVMASRHSEINAYSNEIMQCLETMAAMIQSEDAKSTEESTVATDNGISAFSKIIMNVPLPPDAYNKCVEMFLSWLPTNSDLDESPYIYTCLAELFAKQDPALLGPNNSNLPKILHVGLFAIVNEAFQDDEKGNMAKTRVIEVIKQIAGSFPAVPGQAGLDESLQAALRTILTQ